MKKTIALMLIMTLVVTLVACSSQDNTSDLRNEVQTKDENSTENPIASNTMDSSNILIAYFSMPEDVDISGVDAVASSSIVVENDEKIGNTQFVAQTIQKTIGGELFRIETVEDYPLEHDALVDQAADEQDENFRPELDTHEENFDQYETILLGFPNWWGDMPMAVYEFLEEYDFGDKTIITFITHGGSRASDTLNTISEIQSAALIGENALVLSRNDVATSAEEIIRWAEGLNQP